MPAWSAADTTPLWPAPEQSPRPLLLLPQAEPAEEVMALIPDGPPRRFCWRGVTYDIKNAQGPERIGAEWWHHPAFPLTTPPCEAAKPAPNADEHPDARRDDEEEDERPRETFTRDYFLVEDAAGHRFWLYREGLYGRETNKADWFVHGLFA
jgi:protein ImuB